MKLLKFLMVFVISGHSVLANQFDSLLSVALSLSPKLKMLELKKRNEQSKISQVSNLSDPILTLGVMNLPFSSFSFSNDPMAGKILGLRQMFPFPGKLSNQNAIQNKEVDLVNFDYEIEKLSIVREFAEGYYSLWATNKEIEIIDHNLKVLNQILEIARNNISVGFANPSTIKKVEAEISILTAKRIGVFARKEQLFARLNALLFLPPDSDFKIEDPEEINNDLPPYDSLIMLVNTYNPEINRIIKAIDKSKLEKELAELDFFPDLAISAQYLQRNMISGVNNSGMDMISLMLEINLPLNFGQKRSDKVQEKDLLIQMYQEQYRLLMQNFSSILPAIIAELTQLRSQIKLYRFTLLKQIEESLNLLLANFQVGRAEIVDLLDTERNYFDLNLDYFKLISTFWIRFIELKTIIGTKF